MVGRPRRSRASRPGCCLRTVEQEVLLSAAAASHRVQDDGGLDRGGPAVPRRFRQRADKWHVAGCRRCRHVKRRVRGQPE
jgi:hypothetical protein